MNLLQQMIITGLLGLTFLISGCATIMTGTHQKVHIDSNPKGAKVTISDGTQGITPFTVDLKKKDYRLTAEKEGYKPLTLSIDTTSNGWIWGNCLIFLGVINENLFYSNLPIIGFAAAIAIDSLTGGGVKLDKDDVFFELIPQPQKK